MTKLEAEAESADGHVKEVFSISFLERASRCQWANDGVEKKADGGVVIPVLKLPLNPLQGFFPQGVVARVEWVC